MCPNSGMDHASRSRSGLPKYANRALIRHSTFESRNRFSAIRRSRTVFLIVDHQTALGCGDIRLLQNIRAALPRHVVLKSIFGKLRPGVTDPEVLFSTLCTGASLPSHTCRAVERLQLAVELTNCLRRRCELAPHEPLADATSTY